MIEGQNNTSFTFYINGDISFKGEKVIVTNKLPVKDRKKDGKKNEIKNRT